MQISIEAKKKYKINNIIWAITKKNPFKSKSSLVLKERIKIAKKLIENKKFIKIRFYENKIKSNKTIDLISYLEKNKSLDINFIMGADNLVNFHKWKNWKSIPKIAKIIIFPRKNYSSNIKNFISLKKLSKKDWLLIKTKKINISSSIIKKYW